MGIKIYDVWLVLGLAVIICAPKPNNCAKILVVSNIPSVSHSLWYNKLVNLLLKQHQVVFLDIAPKNINHNNLLGHYLMEGALDHFQDFMAAIKSGAISMESVVDDYSVIGNIDFITSPEQLGCQKLLLGKGFQSFLKDYKGFKFDLMIFDMGCEAFYGLASYFENVPYIVATAYSDPFNVLDLSAGLYDNPSYVPSSFTNFNSKMTIIDKVYNCFYKIYHMYKIHCKFLPNQQALAQEAFSKSVGNLKELVSGISLVMYTYHIALFEAKTLPPNVVPLAGLHIDAVEPLPQGIKTFMDGAKNGVIYFSMGSNLKSIIMSKKNIKMFLDVFRELPQRVVWKLELDDETDIPPNVFISNWMPQNDILAHENVRCFISHGGLLGVQEAVHHGVPILGMPILFDQVSTIKRLEKDGVAVHLSYSKLSKAYIKEKLNIILTNNSIMTKMKQKSKLFRDDPLNPQERALYWIEYVLRHPNELGYLKSPSVQQMWYERLLLDVAAVVLVASVLSIYIITKILVCIKFLICSQKRKPKAE